MKIILKKPNEKPELQEIKNDIRAIQKILGGFAECLILSEECVALVNDEGKLKNLPYNCNILGYRIFGPVILVGYLGTEFADVPEKYIDRFIREGKRFAL